jgi:hypothetical protein
MLLVKPCHFLLKCLYQATRVSGHIMFSFYLEICLNIVFKYVLLKNEVKYLPQSLGISFPGNTKWLLY